MVNILVLIVVCAFVISVIVRFFQRNRSESQGQATREIPWRSYLACLVSGVLFANFVPHFIHSVSGEAFPAPFGNLLGPGF